MPSKQPRRTSRLHIPLPTAYSELTPSEKKLVHAMYVQQQKGHCWFCNGELDQAPPKKVSSININWKAFPPGFLRNPQHLHHDHGTDETIGVVHAYCNAVLWQFYGQ